MSRDRDGQRTTGSPTKAPLPLESAVVRVHAHENKVSHRARLADGALIVMTALRAAGPLSVSACLPDHAHVGLVLEQVGGTCEKRLEPNRRRVAKPTAHEINFVPPDVTFWTASEQIVSCRSISLLFDPVALAAQAQDDAKWTLPDEPWLGLRCEPIATLLRLLAHDFNVRGTVGDLYTDSLIVAITAQLKRVFAGRDRMVATEGLSAAELKRVLEFIENDLSKPIRMRDIMRLTSMSQSRFYAAFKRSTGLPPYRYQLEARIRRAQAQMLSRPNTSLAEIAGHCGFADQAHFGRIFRNLVGESPRAWLNKRRG